MNSAYQTYACMVELVRMGDLMFLLVCVSFIFRTTIKYSYVVLRLLHLSSKSK